MAVPQAAPIAHPPAPSIRTVAEQDPALYDHSMWQDVLDITEVQATMTSHTLGMNCCPNLTNCTVNFNFYGTQPAPR